MNRDGAGKISKAELRDQINTILYNTKCRQYVKNKYSHIIINIRILCAFGTFTIAKLSSTNTTLLQMCSVRNAATKTKYRITNISDNSTIQLEWINL